MASRVLSIVMRLAFTQGDMTMKTMMRMLAIASLGLGSTAYADQAQKNQQGMQQSSQGERAMSMVHFAFDSDVPRGDLLMVANFLECNPNETIILDAYTDPVGTEAYNADLARRRAESVRDRLVDFGIDRGRILLGVFGEAGQSPDEHALARRVEIRSSDQPVAELIEARQGTAVAIVTPTGQVEEGQQPQEAEEPEPETEY